MTLADPPYIPIQVAATTLKMTVDSIVHNVIEGNLTAFAESKQITTGLVRLNKPRLSKDKISVTAFSIDYLNDRGAVNKTVTSWARVESAHQAMKYLMFEPNSEYLDASGQAIETNHTIEIEVPEQHQPKWWYPANEGKECTFSVADLLLSSTQVRKLITVARRPVATPHKRPEKTERKINLDNPQEELIFKLVLLSWDKQGRKPRAKESFELLQILSNPKKGGEYFIDMVDELKDGQITFSCEVTKNYAWFEKRHSDAVKQIESQKSRT
jgi:hypothetical protein